MSNMKYLGSIDWNKTGLLYIFQKDKFFFLWTDHAKIHKGAIILSTVIGNEEVIPNIFACMPYMFQKKKKIVM